MIGVGARFGPLIDIYISIRIIILETALNCPVFVALRIRSESDGGRRIAYIIVRSLCQQTPVIVGSRLLKRQVLVVVTNVSLYTDPVVAPSN